MRYFQPNGKMNVKMKCPSGLQLMTVRRGGRRAQEMEVVIVGKENHFITKTWINLKNTMVS